MRSAPRASSISTCRHRRTACGRRCGRHGPRRNIVYEFDYRQAKSVAEAVGLLGQTGVKPLAGGQSLVAAMKLRLAQPGTLVDLAGIDELTGMHTEGDALSIGAMTRHADIASSAEVKRLIPALAAVAEGIGDRQVRNRGTLG